MMISKMRINDGNMYGVKYAHSKCINTFHIVFCVQVKDKKAKVSKKLTLPISNTVFFRDLMLIIIIIVMKLNSSR